MKLRCVPSEDKVAAVVDEQDRLIFDVPDRGIYSVSFSDDKVYRAPREYDERMRLVREVVALVNRS